MAANHYLKDIVTVTFGGVTLCVDKVDVRTQKKWDDITTNCDEGATNETQTEKKLSVQLEGPLKKNQAILHLIDTANDNDEVAFPVSLELATGYVIDLPDAKIEGGTSTGKATASRYSITVESQGPYTIPVGAMAP